MLNDVDSGRDTYQDLIRQIKTTALRYRRSPSEKMAVNLRALRDRALDSRDREIAQAMARDAGNRSMKKAGRKAWSVDDYNAAADEFHRLYGDEAKREARKL